MTPPVETAKRIGRGTLKPGNWLQLFQFGVVGASGYIDQPGGLRGPERTARTSTTSPAAILAFCVAVTNNFWWNRHWTFDAKHGHAGFQAARFFTVSVLALVINLIALKLLVGGGMSELPAQAIAVAIAMPFNFIGNKLWTFALGTQGAHFERRALRMRFRLMALPRSTPARRGDRALAAAAAGRLPADHPDEGDRDRQAGPEGDRRAQGSPEPDPVGEQERLHRRSGRSASSTAATRWSRS